MTEKPDFKWKVYPDRIEFENHTTCQKIPKKMILRNKGEDND